MKTTALKDIVGAFTLPEQSLIWIKGGLSNHGLDIENYECFSFPDFDTCIVLGCNTQVIPMQISNFTATPKLDI